MIILESCVGYNTDVPLRAEHPTGTCSLHFDQLYMSWLTTVCYKKEGSMTKAENCTNLRNKVKCLRCSLIPWPFSWIRSKLCPSMSLGPVNSTRCDFCLVEWALNPIRKQLDTPKIIMPQLHPEDSSVAGHSFCLQSSQVGEPVDDSPPSVAWKAPSESVKPSLERMKVPGQNQLGFSVSNDSSILCLQQYDPTRKF